MTQDLKDLKETDTYFVPSITDVKIGYEYQYKAYRREALDGSLEEQRWASRRFPDPFVGYRLDSFQRLIEDGNIRVPFLTKEQIEAEGWELYSKGIDSWFKFKNSPISHTNIQEFYGYKPYSLYLNYGFHDNRLKIKCDFSGGLDFGDSDTLFEGGCKDINTFRYICKLLNIN